MPIRLVTSYGGQAAGTLYWGSDQATLRAVGIGDDYIQRASDYAEDTRIVTAATFNIASSATIYQLNSATAQTGTLGLTGYFPIGTVLTFEQIGAGATTIAPVAGVTINNAASSLVTKGVNTINQLVKTGVNIWTVAAGFGG